MRQLIVVVVILVNLLSSTPAFAEDYLNMNLLSKSNLKPEDIDKVFTKTPLEGLGKEFVRVEEVYGINAQYFAAHAILESNWGKSRIAREKNNLFGFGAHDKAPYRRAKRFFSKEEGINKVACFIKNEYLLPNGQYFNDSTLLGMNKKYASDPLWAQKVANRMKLFEPYLPAPQPQLKKEVRELPSISKPKIKDVIGMKTDMSVVWMGLIVLVIIFLLRRKYPILLFITAFPVSTIKAVLFVLKEIVIAFYKSLKPAIGYFYSSLKDDIKEAHKFAKAKRRTRRLARKIARGARKKAVA